MSEGRRIQQNNKFKKAEESNKMKMINNWKENKKWRKQLNMIIPWILVNINSYYDISYCLLKNQNENDK